MEENDLCGYCLRPNCMSAQDVCPGRTRPTAKTATCSWCSGAGGYRTPCHGCKTVGPVITKGERQ